MWERGRWAVWKRMNVDLRDRRELYNGFGDGLSRAFEFAVTPAVFGAMGYAVDRAVGVTPVFTIALLLFAVVGMFVKLWFAYDAEMRRHESRAAWGKH